MQNEILDLIDQIEMEQAIAEMAVCDALMNSYAKSCAILENASDNADLSSYNIFQESCELYQEGEKWERVKQAGSTAWKEAKGKKSENIVIRILKFIPRLIMAFVRSLRTNKKQIDKKIDAIEKVADKITEAVEKGDINEEDISDVTYDADVDKLENDWVDKNGNIKRPIRQDSTQKTKVNKSTEVTERGFIQGKVTGDTNGSARRAAARNTRKLNNAAKNQPLSLPYDPNNRAFYYANGDICFKFPWETFNMLEKMNTKTLDYAELMMPIESALEMIVDAFSEIRSDGIPGARLKQRRNTGELIDNVRSHELPGKIVLIKNKIKEAEQWMSKLNKNFNKKWKIDAKDDVRECKLSEVLTAFKYASQWIGQTEKILEVSAKRIKATVDNLPTFKSGFDNRSAYNPDYSSIDDAIHLKPEDANTITACVNRVQTLVDQANKRFAYIVKNCSDALDDVYAAAHVAAGKAGITTNSLDELSSLRKWASTVPVPDRQGEGFDNVDIHGNRKGVRDFNDLIRAPRD